MSEPEATNGTALAPARGGVPSHRYQLVRNSQILATIPSWVRTRPIVYLPQFASTVASLYLSGYPTNRVIIVTSVYAALLSIWIYQAVRGALTGDVVKALLRTTVLTTLAQGTVIGVTGGLGSPLSPVLVVAVISVVMLLGRGRATNAMLAFILGMTALIAALPQAVVGPPIPWPYDAVIGAITIGMSVLILMNNIYLVTDIHQQVGDTLHLMREDMISTATARARSLETIGSKVAHELKNPLAAIKGLVQLVSRNPTDERSSERIRVIATEVARMEAILRDYLTFSRPLDDLRPQGLNLAALCGEVVQVLEARAQAAVVALSASGEAQVVGDPRRLKEALMNLVQNAIEATGPGGIVTIRVDQVASGARVVVADTGRGLAPDDLAKLGTPFFSMRPGGTGLGVVLARGVIVQHGGEVTYASEVGRGTTVTVTLPAAPSPDGAHTPSGEPEHGPRAAH